MSDTKKRVLPNLVDLPDFLSPLTVKELRQGTRAQSAFSFCFGTLLLGTVILFLVQWQHEGRESGSGEIVLGFLWVLGYCVNALLIPTLAMQSVSSELDSGTHELLLLTGASGWHLVLGKLISPLSLSLVNLTLLLPFATFAYFQRGVALQDILFLEVELLLLSLFMISAAIFIACLGRRRLTRWFARVIAGVIALVFTFYYLGRGFQIMQFGMESPIWLLLLPTALLAILCVPLFLAAAQGRLGRTKSFDTPSFRLLSVLVFQVLLASLVIVPWLRNTLFIDPTQRLQTTSFGLAVLLYFMVSCTLCCGPIEPPARTISNFPSNPPQALLFGAGVYRGSLLSLLLGAEILFVLFLMGDLRPEDALEISFLTFSTMFFIVGSPFWAVVLVMIRAERLARFAGVLLLAFVNWLAIMLAALAAGQGQDPVRMLSYVTNPLGAAADLFWPSLAAFIVLLASILRLPKTVAETNERCRLRRELGRRIPDEAEEAA